MSRSESLFGTCCCCIPIRQGVLLIALITLLACFVEMVGLYTDDFRIATGGYNWWTRSLVGTVGAIGLVCSFGGITGSYDANDKAIRAFWYFTVLRLATMFFVFGVDHGTLSRCEHYRWKLVEPPEFNGAMSAIARDRACDEVRHLQTWNFIIDFLVSSYFSYTAWRLSEKLLWGGSYLILFEKDTVVKEPVGYRATAA